MFVPRNHAACIGSYCDAVLGCEIVTGRYVQLAVERHLDDLEHASLRGLQFDAEFAERSLRFVEAVCTWENGFIQSCNGKLRDELLDVELFDTLLEAWVLIERWGVHYNTVRLHSSPES